MWGNENLGKTIVIASYSVATLMMLIKWYDYDAEN